MSDATITVAPATAAQGETVTFTGSGYQNEKVALWLTYPDGRVKDQGVRVAEGAPGTWSHTITLDRRDPTGDYFLTGQGLDSGRVAIVSFTVTAGNPLAGASTGEADLVAIPLVVSREGVVQLQGRGFAPQEEVAMWMTESDGRVWAIRNLKASDEGTIFTAGRLLTVPIAAEIGSPAGKTYFTAFGKKSQRIAITHIIVVAEAQSEGTP
ncbi:MAG: hypothetical protein HC884_12835 [Chloroflexaceae bacterium]|nr:hypothetical protein [Chloroflexaceae bacterium]